MPKTAAPEPRRLVRRGLLLLAGVAIGAATAVVELPLLAAVAAVYGLTWPWRRRRRAARERILDRAWSLARLETWRLRRFYGDEATATYRRRNVLSYLGLRAAVGIAGGVVEAFLGLGIGLAGILIGQVVAGRFSSGLLFLLGNILLGLVLLFLDVQGLIGLAAVEKRLAARLLGPSSTEALERRVDELAASRAAVMAAVNDERRRIERDLHDGVQQRLVALGMLLGRARRGGDAARTAELLRQAHEETAEALRDLREVSWRVFPTALDDGGLRPALEAVVERCPIPVRLTYTLGARLDLELETVAYFVVSEAVTNAAKHTATPGIDVSVARDADRLLVHVTDHGDGGADPSGGGLSGLARRVAAVDGTFTVDSPAGGPTTVKAELPCA